MSGHRRPRHDHCYLRGNGNIPLYFFKMAARWSLSIRLTGGNLWRQAQGRTA